MDPQSLLQNVLVTIVLLLSLTVHEFAHAWSAWLLGDDTAASQGRLSLNPLVHADFIGTILLPLIGARIGWAKPVPFDPSRFRRSVSTTTGIMLVKSAGPLANVALAVVCAVTFGLLLRFAPEAVSTGSAGHALLVNAMFTNVGLAFFNLIPLPPLDGAGVLGWFLPPRLQPGWHALARFSPLFLVFLVLYGGRMIGGPSNYAIDLLVQLIGAVGA